jgi:hypothetical protein
MSTSPDQITRSDDQVVVVEVMFGLKIVRLKRTLDVWHRLADLTIESEQQAGWSFVSNEPAVCHGTLRRLLTFERTLVLNEKGEDITQPPKTADKKRSCVVM